MVFRFLRLRFANSFRAMLLRVQIGGNDFSVPEIAINEITLKFA
jgi:hypothetical protein